MGSYQVFQVTDIQCWLGIYLVWLFFGDTEYDMWFSQLNKRKWVNGHQLVDFVRMDQNHHADVHINITCNWMSFIPPQKKSVTLDPPAHLQKCWWHPNGWFGQFRALAILGLLHWLGPHTPKHRFIRMISKIPSQNVKLLGSPLLQERNESHD